MEKPILNPFQQHFLIEFKKSIFRKKYYLSGGTALAEFYLHHRYSEDLDFFTQKEQDLNQIKKFISVIAKRTKIKEIEFQQGFGLFTFFLKDQKKRKYKIDFGQYPFSPIQKLKSFNGLLVESMYDIAVNKAHTIAFRPRLRDFIDLYLILKKEKSWRFKDLLKISFEKFEMHADSLQVGENLLQVEKLKDMPLMIKKINLKTIQEFFLTEARKLETKIWR